VPATQANFVWLGLGAATTAFAAGCERRRVIVRPFAGDGVRVTVGRPDENDTFLAAATELAAEVLTAPEALSSASQASE
jgi:histidinol-phosphate aminotransferase